MKENNDDGQEMISGSVRMKSLAKNMLAQIIA